MIKVGTKIFIDGYGGGYTVIKKYNDFVWRLKSDDGEIVNVFYQLDHTWSLN